MCRSIFQMWMGLLENFSMHLTWNVTFRALALRQSSNGLTIKHCFANMLQWLKIIDNNYYSVRPCTLKARNEPFLRLSWIGNINLSVAILVYLYIQSSSSSTTTARDFNMFTELINRMKTNSTVSQDWGREKLHMKL